VRRRTIDDVNERRWAVALVLTGALVVVAGSACSGSDDDAASVSQRIETLTERHIGDAVVRIDAAGRVREVIPVPYGLEMRFVGGYLWVHHRSDGELTQIEPSTRRARVVDIGEVAGIAAAGADLWVSVDGNRLARLDSATGAVKRSFRVASRKLFELGDAGFLALIGDSIWLTVPKLGTNNPQTLWRVDANTGAVLERHRIGVDPTPPLAVGRSLWFVTWDEGLVRFDTDSGRYAAVPAGYRPWGYTFGDASLWVGNELSRQVRRIDPQSGSTRATIATDPKVRGLGFGGGFVWVATETSLQRIDPRTNRVTRTTEITSRVTDEGPIGIAFVKGDVWLSVE
jgi:hypothetical protein